MACAYTRRRSSVPIHMRNYVRQINEMRHGDLKTSSATKRATQRFFLLPRKQSEAYALTTATQFFKDSTRDSKIIDLHEKTAVSACRTRHVRNCAVRKRKEKGNYINAAENYSQLRFDSADESYHFFIGLLCKLFGEKMFLVSVTLTSSHTQHAFIEIFKNLPSG